ncbi:AEC family transporter [Methanobacterium movens]
MDLKSVETVLSIIVMVILGYLIRRWGVLEAKDAQSLNKIVVNLAIPSMIFLAMYGADLSIIPILAPIPLVCIMVAAITGTLAYIWTRSKNLPQKTRWSIIIPAAMLNSGFLGYPIALGVFGTDGLVRAIFYDMGSILVFIGFGIILLFIFGGRYQDILKRAIIFPPLWGIILGTAANYWTIPLGFLVDDVLGYLAGAAIPLIMISLGLSLELKGIKENIEAATITSIIRLIISPAIAFLIVYMIGMSGLERTVTIIQAAMPSAMLSMVLAINYELDLKLTASCVFFTTILSLVTLPIIMALI